MAYKSKLEQIDKERGDVLAVERETAKVVTKLGVEIAGPILFELYNWFAGEPGAAPPTMADPRDNAFLAMLMEHQRNKVARYIDFLEKQQQKGVASGAARKSTESNHGQPQPTTANQRKKEKEIEVEEESPEGTDFPSSTTSNIPPNKLGQAGDTPAHTAGGTGVNAAPGGTQTVTRVAYTNEWDSQIPEKVFSEAELIDRPVSFMLEAIEEQENAQTMNALKKAIEELKPARYAKTCWRFVVEMVQKENAFSAALKKAEEMATRNGDKGEAWLKQMDEIAQSDTLPYNPKNEWLIGPWRNWRVFNSSRGRFLMFALNEARLAAGLPIKRKPGKRKGSEE